MIAPLIILTLVTQQTPTPPPSADREAALIDALNKAVDAAQRAAEAAERSARAAATLAGATSQPAFEDGVVAPTGKPPMFAGTAGVALVWLTGNSNTLTVRGNAGLKLLLGPWTIGLSGNAAYGRGRNAGQTEDRDTAFYSNEELRLTRAITDFLAVYIAGGHAMDHLAQLDWRAFGEAGVTLTWIKKTEGDLIKMVLSNDIGVRYAREAWYRFYATDTDSVGFVPNPAPNQVIIRIGTTFRYALNKTVVFNEQLDLLPDVVTAANFNLMSATSLNVKLIGPLSMSTTFLLRYDGFVAAGTQKLDTALGVAADVTF